MKKAGTMILTVLFASALFVGQTFAAEHEKSGAMGQKSEMETRHMSQTGEIHKASDMMGKTVKNQQGEELGELSEIVFDNQGNVNYIVITKGEVLGVGGEMIPIPWQAADARVQEDSLVVNLEKEKLENAPTIKEGEFNNLSEQQFQQEIRGYYGQGQQMGFEKEQHQKTWDTQEKQGMKYQEKEQQHQEKKNY